MPYGAKAFTVQDKYGNIVPNAWVRVKEEETLVSPTLWADRNGTIELGNPFQTNDHGFALFFCRPGAFKIQTSKDAWQGDDIRYSAVGLAQETDLTILYPQGAWDSGTTYNASDFVLYGGKLFASRVSGNINHTPDSVTPGDTAYWMYLGAATGPSVDDVLDALGTHHIYIDDVPPAPGLGVDGDLYFQILP